VLSSGLHLGAETAWAKNTAANANVKKWRWPTKAYHQINGISKHA